MAAVKVSNNLYICDTYADLNMLWPEGILAAVRHPTLIAKYYKLVSGVFQFFYNQGDVPEKQDIITVLNFKTINNQSLQGAGDIQTPKYVVDDTNQDVQIIVSATEPVAPTAGKTVWFDIS